MNGLWFIPGPPGAEHHPREWYERASGTTACVMGALGARSAFARGTREECENVVAMYRRGANFNDMNVPGSYRMYGARSVDKVTCVVKPVDELPLRPECGDAPYRVAWLNKVPVLREVAETMDRGGGYENVRSSNYFWLDADMAAPGDAHWQWDSFNTAEQMTRNLAAAETGISPACYHGSWNFSRPILGACDNVGDIVANVFGGSLDSVRYFDQKYRDFVAGGRRVSRGMGLCQNGCSRVSRRRERRRASRVLETIVPVRRSEHRSRNDRTRWSVFRANDGRGARAVTD